MPEDDKHDQEKIVFKVLRILMGLFFIYTAVMKLRELDAFVEEIDLFVLFPMEWQPWIAYLGIACELVVGICLVFKRAYVGAVLLTVAMYTVFLGLFIQAWIRGLSLSCHCTGKEKVVESYPLEIGWRFALFLVALLLLWEIYRKHTKMFTAEKIRLSRHI